jgi:hypothetical protein
MLAQLSKNQLLYIVAILASFFLTFINIHNYPVFNPDAVEYIRVAQIYLHQGFHSALMAYDWPFYSILLAWVHKATSLSFVNAGYLINYVFSALLVVAFVRFFEECDASFRQQCFAVIVMLVWHMFVKYQSDIIRGHVYWFFVMLSILLAVRFSKCFSFLNGIAWSGAALFATLMRSEFLFFLIFFPFSVFLFSGLSWRERLHAYFKQNVLLFLIFVLFLLAVFVFDRQKILTFTHVPGLFDVALNLSSFAMSSIHAQAVLIFHHAAKNPSALILFYAFCLLLLKFFLSVIVYFSVVYTALLVYSIYFRAFVFNSRQMVVLSTYAVFGFLVAFVFYFKSLEINGRYLFAGFLPLICFVPFGLEALWASWRLKSKGNRYFSLFTVVVFLLMFVMLLSNLFPFGSRHQALYDASQWLKYSTPANATVYTNSGQLALLSERSGSGWVPFSSGEQFGWSDFPKHPWSGFDYLVLNVDSDSLAYKQRLVNLLGVPERSFKEKHGAAVLVFKLKQ